MAQKYIRIGSMENIHLYDDGDYASAIETDGPIDAGSHGGSDTDFTVVTAIQAGGAGGVGFQYKTRALTLTGGIIETVGAESGWNDV